MAKCLDILLLGKTGVGKSHTGNSILGRKAFVSRPTMESVTIDSRREISKLENGRLLRLVDTPGLLDTRGSKEDGEEMFMKAIKEAIVMNPDGYHVFILVLRFCSRFTKEDLSTISYLKEVFGTQFTKTYCILIMTNGDSFEMQKQEEDISQPTFLDWCKDQTGAFQELLKEIRFRVILFNNYGSKDVKLSQRNQLLDMIDHEMLTGLRYNHTKFERAREQREKLIAEKKITAITLEVQDEISLILQEIERIKGIDNSVDVKISGFQKLEGQIKDNLEKANREKGACKELDKLRQIALAQQNQVEKEIAALKYEKVIEENRQANVEMQRLQAMLEEQKRQQNELAKEKKCVEADYQRARDENNSSFGSSVLGALKWPFKKIASWF